MIKDICRNPFIEYARRIYYKALSALGTYFGAGVASSSVINSNHQFVIGRNSKIPAFLGPLSICFCFISTILSLAVAFIIVPRQVTPWTGLLLTYELAFIVFGILFGCYLQFVCQWGRSIEGYRMEESDDGSHKGLRYTSSCNSALWYYGIGMAFLAVPAPLLPILLGITVLFDRLGLMVAGGMVFALFMTYASEHLAVRIFF